ncbi:MAG: hypothetical protein CL508_06655, partial [Actinobacteria bacterium]|nr:hypothetical protein [Actinomycetota bacterium]
MKKKKPLIILTILFLLASACGGGSESTDASPETSTTSTTTTTLPGEIGEVVDETSLVVPPILLKPLIGATGVLTDAAEDWDVVTEIVTLDMGVKIRTADNGTAQMTFEDGSALLMGGNSVVSVRSFDYDEEAGARVLTIDVISGSIAYDIFSEGLSASLAKIVTPTAELSVHGTEGVFEYDVSTFSTKSTVLEGGEENDDAVFSELLPDEEGNPVLVAVSQTSGTELGSATTGGSGWVEEDSSTVALIVDEFVSNMEGDCSYTCKAETQENLAEGSEQLTADVAANAVFTEGDTERMELAQTLLVAAGAPEDITGSVQDLSEAVAEVAVPEEAVQEFIDANWQEAPEDGPAQELPPMSEFVGTFSDAVTVHENDNFQNLGFDHSENGDFRAQHGMMQFISADTNAVNELAETGDVASAMALAAANMFVNAGQEEFAEGTFCAENPDDAECAAGAPPPEFLAQAFAGNHFVEDMVQGMGFEYTFTENDVKPGYCDSQTWLPECANGPEFVGDAFEEGGAYCEANPEGCEEGSPQAGKMFFGGGPKEDSFCADSPDSPECMGGNAQAVYTFFHVYDEDVLGDDWEPVDCSQYPDDSMCSGEGDFFHQHVGDANGLALDRNDMFDIYGGPQELTGPPPEFCQENPEATECGDNYRPADVYSGGEYVAPGYCDQTPDAPECDSNFGQGGGLKGPLTGGLLAQYAAPDPNARAGEKPNFCTEDPNHPECFRDYYGEGNLDKGEFLGNMFSDDSYVDLAQQGVFYNSIDGADDLASQRYGNHDDYFVLDCSAPGNQNEPGCQEGFDPGEAGLFAGGEDGVKEFEAFNPEDVGSLCQDNPQDPLCYAQPTEGGGPGQGDAFGPPPEGGLAPGTQPAPGGFWGDAEKAEEFQNQSDNFTEFAGNYCDENPEDPTCSQVAPPPPQDGIIQDQDCDDNPYAPGCPQSGGQEGQGPPPEGEGYNPPPGGEDNPPGGDIPPGGQQDQEDCANNPAAPGCQPGQEGQGPPPEGEGYNPPGGEGSPPGGEGSPPGGEGSPPG